MWLDAMLKLGEHNVEVLKDTDLIRWGHRLAKRSCKLVPLSNADLEEGLEFCIQGNWYEIFMADKPRQVYFIERIYLDGD